VFTVVRKNCLPDREKSPYRVTVKSSYHPHVHDEIVIEASPDASVEAVCHMMCQNPSWAKGLILRADGYECSFYKKD
jgi:hypothetical protein